MRKGNFPKLKISIPFMILISVMYVLDGNKLFLPTFIAVFIHEASHIVAIHFCGGKIDRIEVRAFGIKVNVPELKYMSYKREIIIAAMGPLVGIITASIVLLAADVCKSDSLLYFAGINIIISGINLLPVYPLDGGRIILSLVLMFFSVRVSYAVSYILTIASVGVLFGLCVANATLGELNPSLVIFSLYIAFCGIKARATP